MAYARQKLLLQKQQTEDEERRGISMQQRAAVPQRTSFSSSYQSQFINHTQNASVEKVIQSSWRPDSFQVSTQSYSVPTTVLSKSMPCLPLGSPLYPISAEPTLSLNENILNDKELQNALASISEEDMITLYDNLPDDLLANTIADPTYMEDHVYESKNLLNLAAVQTAQSCPADVFQPALRKGGRQKQPPPRNMNEEQREAWDKERARKDSHNKIERKRRDAINERIMHLATILPPNPDLDCRDAKPCKGTVLRHTVDYIKTLQRDQQKLRVTSSHLKQTQDINRKMLLHIQQLEILLQRNGISQPMVEGTVNSQQFLAEIINQQQMATQIKNEPVEIVASSSFSEGFGDDESVVSGDPMLSLTSSPTQQLSSQTSPVSHGEIDELFN